MSVTNESLVSIGLPIFGRPTELRRLLSQLTQQTYKNIEILVSDNSHPDLSAYEVAETFASQDSRIRLFRQEKNIGAINNHDFLKNMASGQLFMWVGDDDEIALNYVENCVRLIVDDIGVSLVGGVGHRYLNGEWWYDYQAFEASGRNVKDRLLSISAYAFSEHWLFEHYWYGIFRRDRALLSTSHYPKSILFHFFVLAESGRIVHCPTAELIKHTTQAELDNHAANVAYKKSKLLSKLRGKNWDNLQQCLPIYFQMCNFVMQSKRLSLLEKFELLFTISCRLIKGPCRKELALYSPFGGVRHFCARVHGGLRRRLIKVLQLLR